MQEEHDVPMIGHNGEKTTRVVLRRNFYWLEMKQDVEHFVHTCVKCQSTKFVYKKKYGLYRPLVIPIKPWEIVSIDSMT
jgi:hypothetical protein